MTVAYDPRPDWRREDRAIAQYASFSDYELAALFHELATQRCTSWEQDGIRQCQLGTIGMVMDTRGVDIRDWDLRSYQ